MATRTTLNVSLPVAMGAYIQRLLDSGRYASASEVIRAAMRLLEECEGHQVPEHVLRKHCEPAGGGK